MTLSVKAGAGYCLIDNKKIKIRKWTDNKPYCMYRGRRYIFNKTPPKDKIVTVEITRARKKKKSVNKNPRNSRRKRLSKRRSRSVFKRSGKSKRKLNKVQCKKKLSSKIATNMREYKKGVFVSRAQAIAVSYSQIKKKYPECKRYFKVKK